jgi:hypothetical protein
MALPAHIYGCGSAVDLLIGCRGRGGVPGAREMTELPDFRNEATKKTKEGKKKTQ